MELQIESITQVCTSLYPNSLCVCCPELGGGVGKDCEDGVPGVQ